MESSSISISRVHQYRSSETRSEKRSEKEMDIPDNLVPIDVLLSTHGTMYLIQYKVFSNSVPNQAAHGN